MIDIGIAHQLKENIMLAVYKFLSKGYPTYKLTQFRNEWALLSDKSKEQLKTGILNGSFTY